ncbi:MAG: hypothetical protein JXA95_07435 [Spirochaetales bacterium]|nr:hypothetical protein [Spirochaetales bacterium]
MELIKAITETSSLLASAKTEDELFAFLADRTCYETYSDFSLICRSHAKSDVTPYYSSHGSGRDYYLDFDIPLLLFIEECNEFVLCHEDPEGKFSALLLRKGMKSGVAYPFSLGGAMEFLLILNSSKEKAFDKDKLAYLNSVCPVALAALQRLRENI